MQYSSIPGELSTKSMENETLPEHLCAHKKTGREGPLFI
ncbi:hypothetical protein BN134_3292 [Cronobacter dublinensis 1210]|uniref:Uncharacterized protein n=1 Tax=Cronobacter dublinensis 1210 TaxID=1208656 RepID=A0ABP1WBN3_9ENTR|nr:hypothetical protein BN134_3292 [Cronobacter dublinensis 1210]